MNKIYYTRVTIATVVGILSVLAFTGLYYPIKIFDIQLIALLQRIWVHFSWGALILFSALVLMTLLFGRIYCSTVCPLGVFQEFLMFLFRRKMVVQKRGFCQYIIAAVIWGSLIGGTVYFVRWIDPYTLFGSAVSGVWLGIIILLIITAVVWFKGRYFCTHICPVGAVLGLLSKQALFKIYLEKDKCVSCGLCALKCPTGCIDFKNKTVHNEACINCFKCLSGCRQGAIHYGIAPDEAAVSFSSKRRKLLVGGLVVTVFAIAFKGGVVLSRQIAAGMKKVILPAGVGNIQEFANRCLNCNLCVQSCPMKIIKKADENCPVIHIDYRNSFCDYDCQRCSQVCPSGAIKRLSLAEKQRTQIGLAGIDKSVCVKCGLCVLHCPRRAITKADGASPRIDRNKCIGCGACKEVCPVQAITVSAVERQKIL